VTQLNLEKILKPADELDILQSENSLIQTKETKSNAKDDLEATYEEAFNDVSNSFFRFARCYDWFTRHFVFRMIYLMVDSGIFLIMGDAISEYNSVSKEVSDLVYDTYVIAEDFYDDNFSNYKDTKRYSEKEQIENLVSQTYETARNISDVIKDLSNLNSII